MDQESFTRLRLACSIATTVTTHIGANDPLTQVHLQAASASSPRGWGIPGWSECRMYWFRTVRNCATWNIPDRPAGAVQSVSSASTAPVQAVSWGCAPPPAPKIKSPSHAAPLMTVVEKKQRCGGGRGHGTTILYSHLRSAMCPAFLVHSHALRRSVVGGLTFVADCQLHSSSWGRTRLSISSLL